MAGQEEEEMRWVGLLAIGLGAVMSASCDDEAGKKKQAVDTTGSRATLVIEWQRLVDDGGKTCSRCGSTEAEILKAVKRLREALPALGIEVELKKSALDAATFRKNPVESNRIWVAGKPLEEWLGATAGKSKCRDVCGPADCRTITGGDRTYESIPAELIERACLKAAAEMVGTRPSSGSC